jgi:hypothetical protein
VRYLSITTVEGRGLILCLHHNVWHLGVTQDRGKGRVTKHFYPMTDLDYAIDKAANLCRSWRAHGFGIKSQGVYGDSR